MSTSLIYKRLKKNNGNLKKYKFSHSDDKKSIEFEIYLFSIEASSGKGQHICGTL